MPKPRSPRHAPQPSAPTSRATHPTALPRLLTVDEVAELLRTTRKGVYGLIRRGTLPGVVRLSRRLLVDRDRLLECLQPRRAVSLTTRGDQR